MSACLRNLLGKVCLLLLLALALPFGAYARAEPKAIDVLPGAFGEAIDTLDEATSGQCIEHANRALQALLKDFELYMEEASQDGYLQILQTTILLPESLPSGATDVERAIWAELYEGAACIASFVTVDNSMNLSDVPYAEVTGRFGDYMIRQDGSVERVSLRGIRSRLFADPVIPGVRVINMGSHYSGIYSYIASSGRNGAMLYDSDNVYNIKVGEIVTITLTENQTTPYRWVVDISDDTVAECFYDEYTMDSHLPDMTGVGGKHRFHFKATAPGTCLIDMRFILSVLS